MNYDSMSVHELVLLASHDGAMQQHFKRKVPSDLPALESALRKAVIREASVGKLVFGTKEVVAVENPDFSHIETTIRVDWHGDKRYPDFLTENLLLIPLPKETK